MPRYCVPDPRLWPKPKTSPFASCIQWLIKNRPRSVTPIRRSLLSPARPLPHLAQPTHAVNTYRRCFSKITVRLPRPPVCEASHIVELLYARASAIAAVLFRVRSLHVQPSLGPLHDVRLLTTVSLQFPSRKRDRTVADEASACERNHFAPGTITAQDHVKVSRVRHGGVHRDRK